MTFNNNEAAAKLLALVGFISCLILVPLWIWICVADYIRTGSFKVGPFLIAEIISISIGLFLYRSSKSCGWFTKK